MQAVARAARLAIQTMATAGTSRQDNARPKISLHSTGAQDNYEEMQNFKLEVSNMLQNYTLGQTEKVLIIKKWLSREGLQLIAMLTDKE